jgi:hypothetical protein
VVTGRVTDAALVCGPAAAHFGWARDDWDALAGAVVAGHVIECGPQATGGNYAFFTELPGVERPGVERPGVELPGVEPPGIQRPGVERPGAPRLGFPVAEVYPDGSSVITKHPGTGGAVTVETVTAQLLYEIDRPDYLGPDVTARFGSIELSAVDTDRVRVSGVRGGPPPETLKVCLNTLGGFRNAVTFVLTGLDIKAKADLVRRQLDAALGSRRPAELTWTLARTDREDADTEETASALLHCAARDADAAKAGRAFTGAAVELGLASYPGFTMTAPPGDASPYGVYRAGYVPQSAVDHTAVLPDGSRVPIAPPPRTGTTAGLSGDTRDLSSATPDTPAGHGPTRRAPLGTVVGARSGDKGGTANLGVWVRTAAAYPWLVHTLTVDALRKLLPETADLDVRRYLLPNLRAVNFVIPGLLGEGVASSVRFDPQAKGLGEWLRSRHADIPQELLEPPAEAGQ